MTDHKDPYYQDHDESMPESWSCTTSTTGTDCYTVIPSNQFDGIYVGIGLALAVLSALFVASVWK
jgi:hypothetical protein